MRRKPGVTNVTDIVSIRVNGTERQVEAGTSVAAALANAGLALRRSVVGERRSAVCGMGTCHECRVSINGVPQIRACMADVAEGMEVLTDG
jgi:D-hydroxyproline dehydrogenase subunit gamma